MARNAFLVSTMDYTYKEMADMHLIYSQAIGRGQEVRRKHEAISNLSPFIPSDLHQSG